MSLAVLADHMASKGRGPDTMLVHMAPEEVRGLQALAESHGGSLTINPETGLPEAGFLKKLLPTIIGFGLSYLSGGTIDPVTAGMIVGGAETARTGDIGKGISAGLGAYGGAGLSAGMATAGTDAMTTAGTTAGMGGSFAEQLASQGIAPGTDAFGQAASEVALQAQKDAIASPFSDKLSAGFQATTSSPQATAAFAKDNAKNLMYAAGPAVMAGANVESKLPQTVTKPGMIRPYAYDPYGGTYEAGVPYEAATKAAGGGLMGMADGGYNPGVLDFAQRSEPVVRMASGGLAAFADGGMTEAQLASINQYLLTNPSAEALAAAQAQYGVSDADVARARQYGAVGSAPGSDIANAPTGPVVGGGGYSEFTPSGGTKAQGYSRDYSGDELTAIRAGYIENRNDPQKMMELMTQYGVSVDDLALAYGGDRKGYQNIFLQAGADPTFGGMSDYKATANDKAYVDYMLKQPNPLGQGTLADVYKAQGIDPYTDPRVISQARAENERAARRADMFAQAGVTPEVSLNPWTSGGGTTTTSGGGGGGSGSVVGPGPGGGSGSTGGGSGTGGGVGGGGGSGSTGGGGSGMAGLRNDYTSGGGSLGYTPYVPTSMADFDAKYNTQTGGSKQHYDVLTGKTTYSPTPYTPTGEIMKPYYESVGRMPVNMKTKKYIFKDGKYVLNPEYVKPSYVLAAEKNATFLNPDTKPTSDPGAGKEWVWDTVGKKWESRAIPPPPSTKPEDPAGNKNGGLTYMAQGGLGALAGGGSASQYNLGGYSDGGRLLRGPGDGVSDSIPATIGNKRPARLADGEFVVPARIVSELGNGSTEAGARKLYAMMDRVQKARGKTTGKGRVAKNSRADKYLPA